jgi:hypothetical protein
VTLDNGLPTHAQTRDEELLTRINADQHGSEALYPRSSALIRVETALPMAPFTQDPTFHLSVDAA